MTKRILSIVLSALIILSLYVPASANSEEINIALNKTVFAVNSADDTEPSMAVDGDETTAWLSGSGNGYARQLVLDLGKAYALSKIRIISALDNSADNIAIYGAEINVYTGKSLLAEVDSVGDGVVAIADNSTAYRYLVFEREAESVETDFGFAEIKVYTTDEASVEVQKTVLATAGKNIIISNENGSIDRTGYLATKGVIAANVIDDDYSTAAGCTAGKDAPVRMMVNLDKATKLSYVAYQCANEGQDYFSYFKIVATDSYTEAKNTYDEADYDVLVDVEVTKLVDGNSGLMVFEVPEEFKDKKYNWVGVIKPCASPEQKYNRLQINTFQAYAPVDNEDDDDNDDEVTDDGFNMDEVSNAAAGKPAFAIGSKKGTDPRLAFDMDDETYWQAKNFESNSEQLIVDLGKNYTIKGIGILPAFDSSADNITIYGASDVLFKDKTALLTTTAVDSAEMHIEETMSGAYRYIIFERSATAEDTDFAIAEAAVFVPDAEAEADDEDGVVSLMTLNKTTYMSNVSNLYHNASKYNESKVVGFNDDDPTTFSGDATSETAPMRIITDIGMDVNLSHVAVQVKDSNADYGNAFKIVATDSYSSAKDNYRASDYDVIAEVDNLKRDSKGDSGLVVVEVPEQLRNKKYRFVGIIKEHATNLTGAANNYNRLTINTLQAYAKASDVSALVAESGCEYIMSDISASVTDAELKIKAELLNGENADKLIAVFIRDSKEKNEIIFAESDIAFAGAQNSIEITASVEDGTDGVWEAALIKGRSIIKYYENLRKETERATYDGNFEGKLVYNQIGSSISAAIDADCSVMGMIVLKPGANSESFGAEDIFAYIPAKADIKNEAQWKYTYDYTVSSDAPNGEYAVVFVSDNPTSVLAESCYAFNKIDVSAVVNSFKNVTVENFAEIVAANSGFFGTITENLLASDTMGHSFILAKGGFEKGLLDKNITTLGNAEAITVAAKAALVIDGAFFGNDVDITPYIGSMPLVFTESYDGEEFMEILASVQKNIPATAKEVVTALGRANALCRIANGKTDDTVFALENYSDFLGIKESTLSTKYSMLDIAKKLSNNMSVVKSDYADGMDDEVADVLAELKKADKVTSSEKGSSSSGGGGGMSLGGVSKPVVPAVTETAVQKDDSTSIFDDIWGYDWAKNEIVELNSRGIISGKGNGKFDPSGTLTREETVKLLILAMNLTTDKLGENNYSDCVVGEWYYPFVTAAKVNELVYGVSKQNFGVGQNVTRQDLAVMLCRALEKRGIKFDGESKQFTDSSSISDYAVEAVNTLCGLGIINGYTDGSFNPSGNATRAEAAVIFHRFLKIIEAEN